MIELIQRKLRKGKNAEVIAEEFEEPLKYVERICAAVMQCGLNADPQVVYEQMQK